jgi:hypothetical protein
VVVSSAAGERSISGENVTTWAEQSFAGMTGFTLTVPGGNWGSGTAQEPPAGPAPTKPAATAPAKPKTRPAVDLENTIVPTAESEAAAPAGYDYLFGETVIRNVSDAAVLPPGDEPESSGDHDGHTVLTSDLAKLRGRRKPAAASAAPVPVPVPVAKLSVVLPDGSAELLDQPILIGRAPSASQVPGGKLPRLVTIGGDDPDISRTHVRIVDEGGTVVVTDLHSRNGTLTTLPGKSQQKLRDGEPTSVIPGTIIDLGGGITLAVKEDA